MSGVLDDLAGGVDNHAARTSSFLVTQPHVIKHRRCLLRPVEKDRKDASDLTVACTTLSDRDRISHRLGSVQTYDYIHISGGIFVARARTECGFEPRLAPCAYHTGDETSRVANSRRHRTSHPKRRDVLASLLRLHCIRTFDTAPGSPCVTVSASCPRWWPTFGRGTACRRALPDYCVCAG